MSTAVQEGRSLLVVLDPSLRSFDGHFLAYDKAIADQATTRGIDTVILASNSVGRAGIGDLECVPCFSLGLEAPEGDDFVVEAFCTELAEGLNALASRGPATLFLHTATHRQIEASVRVLAQVQFAHHRLIVLLRYSVWINPYAPDRLNMQKYRAALASIESHGLTDRVRLVSDSELLIDEYRSVTDLPIDLVPIPHVGGDAISPPPRHPPIVTYLGNARSTKGFQYLPHLIAQIRRELQRGQWEAELQANVMFKRDTESVVALCALRTEPVTLWEAPLSPCDYDALLDRTSLVVLPYQIVYYHSQTSGVFAEAIGKGKPVVVPRGTWMARQLAGTGAGVLFAPGDRVDFARAVREALDDLETLTRHARSLRDVWVRRHNPTAFFDHLIARATE